MRHLDFTYFFYCLGWINNEHEYKGKFLTNETYDFNKKLKFNQNKIK